LHIFLSTGLAPGEAAPQLAKAFGVEPVERDGRVYVALQRDGAEVGGEVEPNIHGAPPDPEPDEISILDGYDIAWELRRIPPAGDARRVAARQLLEEIAERLKWPALLVANVSSLVAAWNPSAGLTDFQAGTSPDIADRDLWRPYAIPA
jgi:hypothetical protein